MTQTAPSKPLRRLPKRSLLLLLLPAGAVLLWISRSASGWADWYAQTVYLPLSSLLSGITDLVPFSLAELLIVAGGGTALFLTARSLWRAVKYPLQRRRLLGATALNLGTAASIIFFLFVLLCGINYSRTPFSEKSGLTVRPSSAEELSALCQELIQEANRLRADLPEDENGVFCLSQSIRQTGELCRQAFLALAEEYPALEGGTVPHPKPILLSRLFSCTNITGVYVPLTMEANVNVDIPDAELPATMCHELSHLRGYMREDEANFIAYLACRQAPSAELRYSGVRFALVYAMNSLYASDREACTLLREQYSPGLERDMVYSAWYWSRFDGIVAAASTQINDAYLKANRQDEGVKSYGRMVDLLLADYRDRHNLS